MIQPLNVEAHLRKVLLQESLLILEFLASSSHFVMIIQISCEYKHIFQSIILQYTRNQNYCITVCITVLHVHVQLLAMRGMSLWEGPQAKHNQFQSSPTALPQLTNWCHLAENIFRKVQKTTEAVRSKGKKKKKSKKQPCEHQGQRRIGRKCSRHWRRDSLAALGEHWSR